MTLGVWLPCGIVGIYGDHGIENGNYYVSILGLHGENRKANRDYHNGVIGLMAQGLRSALPSIQAQVRISFKTFFARGKYRKRLLFPAEKAL